MLDALPMLAEGLASLLWADLPLAQASWTIGYEDWERLPERLAGHMELTLSALAIGILISVPLGILATRNRSLESGALAVASVMQTIPSIALLAIMVPLVGIGFAPAFIALTAYSLLPVLRNTVTGLAGVDRATVEAARGMGMTEGQILRRVQLPLALPVIVAGIRTAAVLVVGIATLAAPVGAVCLGNYIFGGLQTFEFGTVLMGCIAAAVLALLLDGLVRLLEIGTAKRSRPLLIGAGTALGVVCVGTTFSTVRDWLDPPQMIGSKTFEEQFILAEVISRRLEDAGIRTRKAESMGSTNAFSALTQSEISTYVDYSGTIWATLMKREDVLPAEETLQKVEAFLRDEYDVTMLGSLGFENTYVLAMRQDQARRLGVESITDLARVSDQLVFGTDPEFLKRAEWQRLQERYGIRFQRVATMDPTLMYTSIANELVDVITAYSTDGRIAALNLQPLDDPLNVFPPYDAILLLSPDAAQNAALVEALRPMVGTIDNDAMMRANKVVAQDAKDGTFDPQEAGMSPVQAAARMLLGEYQPASASQPAE